jgi:hypothetical protein
MPLKIKNGGRKETQTPDTLGVNEIVGLEFQL